MAFFPVAGLEEPSWLLQAARELYLGSSEKMMEGGQCRCSW
jgi:hypothetical protein